MGCARSQVSAKRSLFFWWGKLIRQMDTLEKAGYLYVAVDQTHLQTLYGEQKAYQRAAGLCLWAERRRSFVVTGEYDRGKPGDRHGRPGRQPADLAPGALWMCQKIPMDDLQAEIVILIPFYELYSSSILSVLLLFDCHRLWYPAGTLAVLPYHQTHCYASAGAG